MNLKRLNKIVAEPELPQDWDILNGKLSIEQQQIILNNIFGFIVEDGGVIYDEDGDEFYAYGRNELGFCKEFD